MLIDWHKNLIVILNFLPLIFPMSVIMLLAFKHVISNGNL